MILPVRMLDGAVLFTRPSNRDLLISTFINLLFHSFATNIFGKGLGRPSTPFLFKFGANKSIPYSAAWFCNENTLLRPNFSASCRLRETRLPHLCSPDGLVEAGPAKALRDRLRVLNATGCFCSDTGHKEYERLKTGCRPDDLYSRAELVVEILAVDTMRLVTEAEALQFNTQDPCRPYKNQGFMDINYNSNRKGASRRFVSPSNSGALLASILRSVWSSPTRCDVDIFLVSTQQWRGGSQLIVADTAHPFVYVNISAKLMKDYGQNFTKRLLTRLARVPYDSPNPGHVLMDAMENVKIVFDIENHKRKDPWRPLKNKATPFWAVIAILCCVVIGIVLALVGHLVTSERNIWALATGSSTQKSSNWKMGFSGGVWGGKK